MLYIISTPLGNLSDLIPQAIEAMKTSDYIVCEDTRVTSKLLSYYGISGKVLRYNEHSDASFERISLLLKGGSKVCFLTDAGTPCISDPGWRIVRYARENNIDVKVIGGSSALIYALAGSGFDASRFTFLGFLPRSQTRAKRMLSVALTNFSTVVVYESPKRVKDLLDLVLLNFGDIKCVVAREITKIYEEWIYGKISEVIKRLNEKEEIKGEITLVFSYHKEGFKISRIGFVCSGNTCRSVMAENYARKIILENRIDNISVSSAGLCVKDEKVSENTTLVLRKENISLSHTPKQIDRYFIESNDLILTMTRDQKKKILAIFPEYDNKVFTLSEYSGVGGDVYDPYGKDYTFYEAVFEQIKRMVDVLIRKVSEVNNNFY